MPASPVTIFTPPGAGATPTAPGAIYEPAPVGKAVLAITGVATAGINGSLIYAGLNDAKAAWSSDGTLTAGASNTICKSDAGVWILSRGSAYSATKTSGAATPDGLTTWTVTTGTGSPTLAAASVAAAAVVFTPPSAGSAPAPPVIVFPPAAAPVNQIRMTGGSFLGSGGQRIFNPQAPAYDAGFTTYTAFDSSIYHYAGNWVISFGADYGARISSTAASPVDLTGWTILNGTGQPTIVELFSV